jgi:hypothetical protein
LIQHVPFSIENLYRLKLELRPIAASGLATLLWRYDKNQTGRDKKITVQILFNSAFIRSPRAGIMPTLFHTLGSG